MVKKTIVFITGSRADFGKQKSLIEKLSSLPKYKVYIFATGMHMNPKYGKTVHEITKSGFKNIYTYINNDDNDTMDKILSKTIVGLSSFVEEVKPDLIIVHGDRVEALAGAIVGSLNNILVGHIEGGEVSGTVDELIRHAISKLSHIHFVSNEGAKNRLIQMGEESENIYIIGSPDLDIMVSDKLPPLGRVKEYYEISFSKYALLIFHPVTTEVKKLKQYSTDLVDAVIESDINYIVVYPNNDLGSKYIFQAYNKLIPNQKFKIFPSLRFEYFLVLLKHAMFVVGNSSLGIREAPFYAIPSINVGTRQNRRALSKDIIDCGYSKKNILAAIEKAKKTKIASSTHFGSGHSAELFYEILEKPRIWHLKKQKYFQDR